MDLKNKMEAEEKEKDLKKKEKEMKDLREEIRENPFIEESKKGEANVDSSEKKVPQRNKLFNRVDSRLIQKNQTGPMKIGNSKPHRTGGVKSEVEKEDVYDI